MFTWQRGKIRERLNRGVANAAWHNLFPDARLMNSEITKSYHRPLEVVTDTTSDIRSCRGAAPKKFEVRWLKEETVEEIVHAAWDRAAMRGEGPTLMQKARMVHEDLHVWDRDVLKASVKRLKKLRKELERTRRSPMTDAILVEQKELLLKIELKSKTLYSALEISKRRDRTAFTRFFIRDFGI